jgi:hypothetical protein
VLECCEYRPDDHDHDDPKSTVKSVGDPGDVSSRLPVLNDFVDDSFLRLDFVILNIELLKEFFGHCEISGVDEGGFWCRYTVVV